jgi:predicted phage-related endonuclease
MEQVLVNIKDDYCAKFFNKDLVSIDEILNKLSELEDEKEAVENELKELKQDVEDNYRPVSYAEQVGYSQKDFI